MESSKSTWIVSGAIIVGAPHQRAWSSALGREVATRAACEQIVEEPRSEEGRETAAYRLRVEN